MSKIVSTKRPTSKKFIDYSGEIINDVKILEYAGVDKHGGVLYSVICPFCGNNYIANICDIKRPVPHSCGCRNPLIAKANDKYSKLIGTKINKLTILNFHRKTINGTTNIYLDCMCDCKTECTALARRVLNNTIKACKSCSEKEHRENLSKSHSTHSLSKSRLYSIHHNMKDRCYNPKNIRWKTYGGKGITICDEWLNKENGFINFYNWAMSNGYDDTLSIDRIDENGNYEPSNCRWANNIMQSNNRKNIQYIGIKLSSDDNDIIYCFPLSIWVRIINTTRPILRYQLIKNKGTRTVAEVLTKILSQGDSTIELNKLIDIPQEYLQYNRPDKYEESIHD